MSKANGSTITYAYDNLGNLLQVKNSTGSTVDYTMDGLNRRMIRKANNAYTDGFLYQSSLKPIAQLNENGSVRAIFVYGSRFNSPDLIVKGGVTYRVIHDHVGSPIYVINTSNNAVAQKIVYDSWGNVKSDTSPGFQPFGFAGGLYDSATGLLRFGARDYDPTVGRWLNKDPIKFKGGWNLYAYAGNDPVNLVDPSGLDAIVYVEGVHVIVGIHDQKSSTGVTYVEFGPNKDMTFKQAWNSFVTTGSIPGQVTFSETVPVWAIPTFVIPQTPLEDRESLNTAARLNDRARSGNLGYYPTRRLGHI